MHARVAAALAASILIASPALATDASGFGGPGGNVFRLACKEGGYLIGLKGRFGDWIDQVGSICAVWEPDQRAFGNPRSGVFFGGGGGQAEFEVKCPRGFAVQAIDVDLTLDDEVKGRFVDNIGIVCRTAIPPAEDVSLRVESHDTDSTDVYLHHSGRSGCPPDERAAGIHGRAGRFVDFLGLVCAPAPPPPLGVQVLAKPGKSGTSLDKVILQPKSTVGAALGSSTCNSGFVHRLARPADDVCVTPESHARVVQENATAASRRDSKGNYGPFSCIKGFVWRQAFEGDLVCVTPEIRQLVLQENALAASRSTGATQLMRP